MCDDIQAHRVRCIAAARMAALGLERDLPRVALIGAQMAARALLLHLSASRPGLPGSDLRGLLELAALDRTASLLSPEMQAAMARDVLVVLGRVMHRPASRLAAEDTPQQHA